MPHKLVGKVLKCTAYNTAGVHKVIVTDSQSRLPYFEISPTRGLTHEIGQVLSADL